jgi:hypothetical protein
MRTEGKVSKVAICENCNSYVLAGHIDYLDKKNENEFNSLANDGFIVKTETIEQTQSRTFSSYQFCFSGGCAK